MACAEQEARGEPDWNFHIGPALIGDASVSIDGMAEFRGVCA